MENKIELIAVDSDGVGFNIENFTSFNFLDVDTESLIINILKEFDVNNRFYKNDKEKVL